ncbi:AraC family transcriptional regulator [Brevibacillus parabrevis]|uniref:AraC family transcriptional regulator n=1 Tax=Brevibacillus parabrevis TaxID=54914 RepID=UPI001C2129AD|nr:AraC family transcriptional regulator [Brevibacillus parabrevis]MBU8710947.1 AraC family transcriptional regulator [Brevibacillus parabrevis]
MDVKGVIEHIMLWNHASIKVLDVRHQLLGREIGSRSYKLPASTFLFAAQGKAQICLDGSEYAIKPYDIAHSGKGTLLDIFLAEDVFEYYLIFYRAAIPLTSRQQIVNLLRKSDPFQLPYSFQPCQPIELLALVKQMDEQWQCTGELERFQTKALFYQFVSAVHRQLLDSKGARLETDPAAQAKQYIQNHYAEPITLEALAEMLRYSVPHLSALFKKKTGYSLIDYLIRVRMEKSASLLVETDRQLREIAESVGYRDPYYFGRLFKKVYGISPARFRATKAQTPQTADRPATIIGSSIAALDFRRYIDSENHYPYKKEGRKTMYRPAKPSAAATVMLCLTLMLAACSGNAGAPSQAANGNQTETSAASDANRSTQTSSTPAEASSQTQVISTVKGDVVVPATPRRIVADQYLGTLITLGVTPIGAPGLHRQNPYITEALKNVEDIGDVNGSLEKVIDLQPDLIVTESSDDQGRYDQLSKIAPTISIPYGQLKNIQEELTFFGKLLGKEQEAKDWLADYEKRIAAAKERVRKVIPEGKSFSIIELTDKQMFVYGDNFGRGGQAVYQALGLKPPAAIAKTLQEKQWLELSSELLSQYAGDYIILTSNSHTLEDLKKDPLWSSLDAVKNNHVYVWKEERSWYYDPIAVLSQTEEIADWLTKQ